MNVTPGEPKGLATIKGVDGKTRGGQRGRLYPDGLGSSFEETAICVGQFLKTILKAGREKSVIQWKSEAEKGGKFEVKDFGKLSELWDESEEKAGLRSEEAAKSGETSEPSEEKKKKMEKEVDPYRLEEVVRNACEAGVLQKVADEGEHVYIFGTNTSN
ncbi:uncharacterized protein LOC135219661 [Macrobrachium nipponense]|uniref:uncharacterized protein LOC135219661 n=1 Tax=Macrobrachium nipponense TaxID=159736 RepID=UPI0030C815A1